MVLNLWVMSIVLAPILAAAAAASVPACPPPTTTTLYWSQKILDDTAENSRRRIATLLMCMTVRHYAIKQWSVKVAIAACACSNHTWMVALALFRSLLPVHSIACMQLQDGRYKSGCMYIQRWWWWFYVFIQEYESSFFVKISKTYTFWVQSAYKKYLQRIMFVLMWYSSIGMDLGLLRPLKMWLGLSLVTNVFI